MNSKKAKRRLSLPAYFKGRGGFADLKEDDDVFEGGASAYGRMASIAHEEDEDTEGDEVFPKPANYRTPSVVAPDTGSGPAAHSPSSWDSPAGTGADAGASGGPPVVAAAGAKPPVPVRRESLDSEYRVRSMLSASTISTPGSDAGSSEASVPAAELAPAPARPDFLRRRADTIGGGGASGRHAQRASWAGAPAPSWAGVGPGDVAGRGARVTRQSSVTSNVSIDDMVRETPAIGTLPADQGTVHRLDTMQDAVVKRLTLPRGEESLLGISLKTVDGVMGVSFVMVNSAAHKAGVRFGDQLVAINGRGVQGKTSRECIRMLRSADSYEVVLELLDRQLLQTFRFVKEEWTSLGVVFRNGCIDSVKPGSLAALSGIPRRSHVVEVNGDLVVGLNDLDLLERFRNNGRRLEVRLMREDAYRKLISRIPDSYVRFNMEHANSPHSTF